MSSQRHEVLSDVTLPHLTPLTSSPPPTPQWASTPRASLLLLRHASHAPSSCWRCPLARMCFDIPYGCSHTPTDLCSNVTFSVKPSLTSLIKTVPPPSPSGLPYVSSRGYHHPGHNIFTWLLTPVSSTRTELQHVGEFVLFAALSPESTISEWSRHMEQTRSYE